MQNPSLKEKKLRQSREKSLFLSTTVWPNRTHYRQYLEEIPLAQLRNSSLTISTLQRKRTHMASKAARAAKDGIRAWLMPEISDIKLELSEIRGEVKSLHTKVEEMDKRLSSKIEDLDNRLDIAQRLS